ncbi:hypothetical protein CPC08DRAFT_196868 [Agrocybe pediades]|nr:hypothetical protein CPC08DRAFT_196868 [Agrocybe pediades]
MSTQTQNQQQSSSATKWLQDRFTSLYESTPSASQEDSDFKALFYSAFSEKARVVRNHKDVGVEDFLNAALGTGTGPLASACRVEWKDIVELPVEEGSNVEIVAGFYVVTRSSKIRIRAGPMQRLSYNSFSARIEQDAEAVPDVEGSKRRITELYITTVDKTPPIHLPTIPKNKDQEESTINPALLREQK